MKPQHHSTPALPEFVPLRDLRRALGNASHATIAGLVADGLLPQPLRPRHNLVLFEKAAVLQAIERMRAAA